MKKIIIIGSGPAGISASLYTARAGIDTKVIYKDAGALAKAEKIENYYGTGSISGKELHKRGLESASSLGVNLINDEVLSIDYFDNFKVRCVKAEYEADAVILAAGTKRKALEIKGLRDFETRGISYCAVCDAFACRGKVAAVIGSGEYALHEAEILSESCQKVYILTNGVEPTVNFDDGSFCLIKDEIIEIYGGEKLSGVRFKGGNTLEIYMLFLAVGTAGSSELALKLGAMTENGIVKVDENMASSIPGFFAAGDCVGGILQVSKAVGDGAKAALSAIEFLKRQKMI